MARSLALAATLVASLLAVSGAGGATAQTPKRGGTVVIQRGLGLPTCLNPLREECDVFWAFQALEGAFEPGPFTFRPNLVSGVDFTRRPPFVLTYHIRPEARWSDGVPVTASDFVFTYQAIRKYASPDDLHRRYIQSVRVVDAKTLRVVLRSRFAGYRDFFDRVLPRHALRGEDLATIWIDRMDNPKTGQPIGSGPFLIQSLDRDKQVVLVRNGRYWGPHRAYLDRIVVRLDLLGSEAIFGALRRGELDVFQAFARTREEQDELRQLPGVSLLARPGATMEHLLIRVGEGGHPALRNKLVRRALAFGIDREALARTHGNDAARLESMLFPSRSPYYRPNWNVYRYRPAEARRMLEQAGCRRGADGIYVCSGERLSLRLTTVPRPDRTLTVELTQTQLRRIGVEVRPEYADSVVLTRQILPAGNVELALFSWSYGPTSSGFVDLFGCGGPLNFYGYCQRLVTADLDQADRIFDLGQRARVLNRADATMAKDVPLLPLYNPADVAAVRSSIRGFEQGWPFNLWHAENWWLDR